MNKLMEALKKRSGQVGNLMTILRERADKAPEGTLCIRHRDTFNEYYHQLPVEKNSGEKPIWMRSYLSKGEMDVIKALAQKSYETELLRAAEKQYAAMEAFLKDYDPDALKSVCEKLPLERKELINAIIPDDEMFVKLWEAEEYPPSEFGPNDPEFYTKKGERVRSKSEIIIADLLRERKVPYRYEKPHEIRKGEKLWRPDFTVLNVRERKEIIFEHLGRMDDPDYVRKNMRKFSEYLRNGYYPGENLVFTIESSDRPLSVKDVELIINRYFL